MTLGEKLQISIDLIEKCGDVPDPGRDSVEIVKAWEEMDLYITDIANSIRTDVEDGKIPKIIRSNTDLSRRLARIIQLNVDTKARIQWNKFEEYMLGEGLKVKASVVPSGRSASPQIIITVEVVQ